MQRVMEFKKRNFWSSRVDIKALNDRIAELNNDGWIVKDITPNITFVGFVTSYTLLLELK